VNRGRVAVINIQKIAENLRVFKEFRESLNEEKASIENKAQQDIMKLAEEGKDLELKSEILSEKALKERTKKIQEKYMKIREEAESKIANIQNKLNTALINLNRAVEAASAELIREKSGEYSMVIEKQVLLYYNAEDDITMEILKKLAKKKLNLAEKSTDEENR
jgi:Skp family chaperone for outer membrane proteins